MVGEETGADGCYVCTSGEESGKGVKNILGEWRDGAEEGAIRERSPRLDCGEGSKEGIE